MLFLHGYNSSKESFYYQTQYFSRYYKVYAPDLPGFKEDPPYPYSLDDYVGILDKFIKETDEKSFHVIAHSFGARMLIRSLPSTCFDKIVLTGAAGLKPKRKFGYFVKKWGYKSIKRFFGKNCAEKFASKQKNSEYALLSPIKRQSFVKIVNEHLDYRLINIQNKTLIIEGESDSVTPLYMAKRFNRGLKNSTLVVISGGHFAFVDNPIEFNFLVKDFLTDD